MTTGEKWGLATVLTGLALTVAGFIVVGGTRRRAGDLGRPRRLPRVVDQVESRGATLTHYYDKKMPIEQRVGLLQNLVFASVKDPQMRKLALGVTSGCQARDGDCEAKAVYQWTRGRIRYTGDVAPIKLGSKGPVDGVDLFQSAARTVEFGGGDCDDHSVLNATLLALNGIPAKFRITAARRGDTWSHIYVIAGLPKTNPTKWVAIDTTLPGNRYGTEAPHARRVDYPA